MEEIDRSLARVVLARTLKMGLRHPSEQSLQGFSCETGRRALRRAAEIEEPGGGAVTEAVQIICSRKDIALAALASSYESIFGHSLRGRVCPYETEYVAEHGGGGAPFQQSQELADISGFYLAFGLEATQAGGERLDHAACEFEFVEFLFTKEAWAIEKGDSDMLEVTRKAIRDFLRGHLGRFGVALGSALDREDPGGFYGAMGALCAAFLRRECGRLGLDTGPELLELRPEGDDGVPMACGGADGSGAGPELLGILPHRRCG